jgi:hypothetical protein
MDIRPIRSSADHIAALKERDTTEWLGEDVVA